MVIYPSINPIAFHLGPLPVHWYGLMYLLSFGIGWLLMIYRARRLSLPWTNDQISDLLFYLALGVIIGGRLGFMLFYDFSEFIRQPWVIVKVWEGGMSFHGGLLGVMIAMWLWAYKNHFAFLDIADFVAPVVPFGLAAGRFGNFINCDFLGRITDVPWAWIYPRGGYLPRHPSTIYELLLEGLVLFIVLWLFSLKKRKRGAVSGLFLLGYGCIRFFCEFFREPDPQLGFIAWNWLTMGQLLSSLMIIGGVIMLVWVYNKR